MIWIAIAVGCIGFLVALYWIEARGNWREFGVNVLVLLAIFVIFGAVAVSGVALSEATGHPVQLP
jgi:hypothetical protein